ncbi:type III secretion system inner rod subunit SctI [Yoonia sp. BS5-3]|uniref:Type III secretion system inner rod subunit SctI n=1 Tax=Yoonia phaeophyticola TaxID=3137369 RepID=A0ABZ2V5E7_9RHOB
MSISAASLTNVTGTSTGINTADLTNPAGAKSQSVLRFEQSMARADIPAPEPVAFSATDGINAAFEIDAAPRPETFVQVQATPADQIQPVNGNTVQATPPTFENPLGAISEIKTAAVEAPGTGQGIIDGLSKLRGVFDAQEQAVTGITPADTAGARLTNTSELINLQLEVVKYSMLMDVTSKLAGKSTQTFDTLMKGQ